MTPIEVKKALSYIESIDEDDEQAYEKILNTFINIRFIPALINTFYKNEPSGKARVTFRTRTHTDSEFFLNKEDISYPPSNFVRSYARCNRPNQSVFYGAENRPTSYMELIEYWAKEHEIGGKVAVTIGMWEFQRDLNLYIIPKPFDRVTEMDKYYGEVYDIKMTAFNSEAKELADIILGFMYDYFSRPAKNDKKTYLITSAFTNLIMTNPNVDGIIYPSVPYGGQGFNSAIKRSVVESGALKLVDVTKDTFKIEQTEEGKHHFIQIDSISTNDINDETGEITWNHTKHFFQRLIQFKNPFT